MLAEINNLVIWSIIALAYVGGQQEAVCPLVHTKLGSYMPVTQETPIMVNIDIFNLSSLLLFLLLVFCLYMYKNRKAFSYTKRCIVIISLHPQAQSLTESHMVSCFHFIYFLQSWICCTCIYQKCNFDDYNSVLCLFFLFSFFNSFFFPLLKYGEVNIK